MYKGTWAEYETQNVSHYCKRIDQIPRLAARPCFIDLKMRFFVVVDACGGCSLLLIPKVSLSRQQHNQTALSVTTCKVLPWIVWDECTITTVNTNGTWRRRLASYCFRSGMNGLPCAPASLEMQEVRREYWVREWIVFACLRLAGSLCGDTLSSDFTKT